LPKAARGHRVGYIRVSSIDQNTERQLDGLTLDKTFTDKASGKDVKRPQLEQALGYVRDGDTLVVHSLDRLARNAEDLLRLVRQLNERGITVEFVKNRLTFQGGDDPMAKMQLTILGAVAEFERALLRERQREGIAIAKAKGKYKGRKPALNPMQAEELRRRVAEPGSNKAALAREFGISRETLYQYCPRGA
jgi:DNA invertase Pin-like site-specific DNA recombinase